MAYIKSNYSKILEAKAKGDTRAKAICKAVYDGVDQDIIDSMVEAFLEPFPQETTEVMPKEGISEFGAGAGTEQPQALSEKTDFAKNGYAREFKPENTVFHDDYVEEENEEDWDTEEIYDIKTIEKIQSLLKDKNLSANDINRLLEGMKNGR